MFRRSREWAALAGECGRVGSGVVGISDAVAGRRRSGRADARRVRQFSGAGLTVDAPARRLPAGHQRRRRHDGFGNHKHNDLLGFEYHVAGVPVIVDPGSYVYTSDPDARNLFRSTRSHNTLSVDGQEQNEFKPGVAVPDVRKAAPEHLALVEDDELQSVSRPARGLRAPAAAGRPRADVHAWPAPAAR